MSDDVVLSRVQAEELIAGFIDTVLQVAEANGISIGLTASTVYGGDMVLGQTSFVGDLKSVATGVKSLVESLSPHLEQLERERPKVILPSGVQRI